jgi:hypothetical protein
VLRIPMQAATIALIPKACTPDWEQDELLHSILENFYFKQVGGLQVSGCENWFF